MAFGFFKKKDDAPAGADADRAATTEGSDQNLKFDSAKARRFFDHAQAMHDGSNYEYAMTLWLQGLRMDASSMNGLEGFARSASAWVNAQGGKTKGPTKDQLGAFSGKGPLEKYLRQLLEWGASAFLWQGGLKAFESAAKLKLSEPGYWIGARVLGQAGQDGKAKKDAFVEIMGLFAEIGGYDKAVIAGEIACRLDPSDGKLAAEVKNLSAQATMSSGGYDQTGKQGGFRSNVRDIQGQREKEEEERIVKTEDVQVRSIERAMADYQSRPTDVSAIQKVARLLRERGTPDDEKQAYQILVKGYEDTKNYRFRMEAGDIRMRAARRKLRELREVLAADPANPEKQQNLAKAERQVLEMEVREYEDRVTNVPTDLLLRFELAKRCMEIGQYEKAVEHYQLARGSPGMLTQVLLGLGTAFSKLGWLDEAETSYREAITSYSVQGDDMSAELRYGLMDVLERKARDAKDLSNAEEAFKLAASIAMQKINFKDIRARRQQLQELVKGMREG